MKKAYHPWLTRREKALRWRMLLWVLLGIVLVVVGYFGYKALFAPPAPDFIPTPALDQVWEEGFECPEGRLSIEPGYVPLDFAADDKPPVELLGNHLVGTPVTIVFQGEDIVVEPTAGFECLAFLAERLGSKPIRVFVGERLDHPMARASSLGNTIREETYQAVFVNTLKLKLRVLSADDFLYVLDSVVLHEILGHAALDSPDENLAYTLGAHFTCAQVHPEVPTLECLSKVFPGMRLALKVVTDDRNAMFGDLSEEAKQVLKEVLSQDEHLFRYR